MKEKIAFDIGACTGETLNKFKDYDIIYAFEPNPFSFNILEKKYNNINVKLFNIAISDENGYKKFNCHDHYQYSSFLKILNTGEFAEKCHDIDMGYDNIVNIIDVETMRLDTFMSNNFIPHIDYLKIDTQGYDLNVVKSLGDMINKVKIIELETQIKPLYKNSPTKEEIINYMISNKFKLVSSFPNSPLVDGYEEILIFENTNQINIIPVIGIPILNGTYWLQRLISSIDYPVDNVVIFNNGNKEIIEELDNLTKINHPYINNITICHLPSNLGVSAAWNLTIKSYNTSPYWVISNHDIAFTPGLLKEMYEKAQNEEIGMVHGSGGDFNDGSYDLFLIKDWVIQKLGLFDENLSPAYCEDADYIMRITRYNWDNPHNQIKKISSLSTPYYHGIGLSTDKNYYQHGSQTKKQNDELTKKLDEINIINFQYMNMKWGEGWRMTNPQMYPMGIENMPITYTSYDLEFIRTKNI